MCEGGLWVTFLFEHLILPKAHSPPNWQGNKEQTVKWARCTKVALEQLHKAKAPFYLICFRRFLPLILKDSTLSPHTYDVVREYKRRTFL